MVSQNSQNLPCTRALVDTASRTTESQDSSCNHAHLLPQHRLQNAVITKTSNNQILCQGTIFPLQSLCWRNLTKSETPESSTLEMRISLGCIDSQVHISSLRPNGRRTKKREMSCRIASLPAEYSLRHQRLAYSNS